MRGKVQKLSALGMSRGLPVLKGKKRGNPVAEGLSTLYAWESFLQSQGPARLGKGITAPPLYFPLVKFAWAAFWFVSLFLNLSCAQDTRLKPGLWEYEMSFDMPDRPKVSMPPIKWQQCVKEEEAKQGTIFSGQQPSPKERPDCKVENIRHPQPGHVTYEVTCAHPTEGKMRMIVDYRYTETSFEGTSRIETNGQEFTYKMKGKYLGSCKK
jgi:hypothetical protein